jgi:3-phenylpropionate/trans-cinnamate dioxygenase ferredoxin reductase component
MSKKTFVIVGASLAGAKAAERLRERGFDGRVVLIGSEPELPYERPPLSKDYLRGEAQREQAQVHEEAFYSENEIELLLDTTVTELDTGGKRIELTGRAAIPFDALLLSTGSRPRRLDLPGGELEGIYYLRTLADCDALKQRLEQGGHVAVVGGGWIGCEVAATARQRGLEVTLIHPEELPMLKVLGSDVAEFYRNVHADHGVEFVLGEGATAFEGDGHASAVRTDSGRTIACDFVVVGSGALPNAELAEAAGVKVDNGVRVDAQLRSSAPDVFAAGDVANAWHPFYEESIRIEHWATALNQGPAAANSMLGDDAPYDHLPYFFSDQYDVGMEYSGRTNPDDRVVFRGERDSGEFMAFWLRADRVVAGMNVNVWDVNEHVQALIRSRAEIDVKRLTDPDTPLTALIPEAHG